MCATRPRSRISVWGLRLITTLISACDQATLSRGNGGGVRRTLATANDGSRLEKTTKAIMSIRITALFVPTLNARPFFGTAPVKRSHRGGHRRGNRRRNDHACEEMLRASTRTTSDRSGNVHQVERGCALSSVSSRGREPSMDITHLLGARNVSGATSPNQRIVRIGLAECSTVDQMRNRAPGPARTARERNPRADVR